MTQDPYAALGLKKSATDAEIKKAYRKIARSCHPDLKPGDSRAEARFKAASAAYDLLKDPETRARFDRGEIDASGAERAERRYWRDHAGADRQAWHANPFGAGGGGPWGQQGAGFDDASDIFAEFLRQQRGGGGSRRGVRARGQDLHFALEVPFLDATLGGATRITLPDGGSLEVRLPEGTTDGQVLRLRGKGGPGIGGGAAGDALITISLRPHPVFRREGDDILITLPITIDEALLGARVETPTIDGPVKLSIPKGASSGQILRLRGRGAKVAGHAGKRGDQKVELRIVSPPVVDAELAEFMTRWRATHHHDPRAGLKAATRTGGARPEAAS